MKHWSALVLAGGAGRRFGGGKLLASLAGEPVIRRTATRVASAGFAEVLVVTGADDAAIREAVASVNCRVLHAPAWAEGMSATLRHGIAALAPEASGVCVFLGDMPLVPVSHCPALIAAAERAGYAARTSFQGRPGHPAAFTRAAFSDLLELCGDAGAGALLQARTTGVAVHETDDSGAVFDIDTPDDLAAAKRAFQACATSAMMDSPTSRGALPKP